MASTGERVKVGNIDETSIYLIKHEVLRVVQKILNCDNVEFFIESGSESGEFFFKLLSKRVKISIDKLFVFFQFLFKNKAIILWVKYFVIHIRSLTMKQMKNQHH